MHFVAQDNTKNVKARVNDLAFNAFYAAYRDPV